MPAYAIFTVFPPKQWMHERASVLRETYCNEYGDCVPSMPLFCSASWG